MKESGHELIRAALQTAPAISVSAPAVLMTAPKAQIDVLSEVRIFR
jgi:hypothetical protein